MEKRKRARKNSISNRELLIAASENDLENMHRLIKEGADINFKDRDFNTPLHWAVENGHLEVIKLLLNREASTKIKNNEDKIASDIARDIGRLDIVEILENPINGKIKNNVTCNGKIIKKETKRMHAIYDNIYQLKMLMLFLYRGVSHKYSFRLDTKINNAKINNLIFEYSQNNNTVYRLLKTKYIEDETKKITANELLSITESDFNLMKYFATYKDCKKQKFFRSHSIKDVIMCTNIGLDLEDLKNTNITVQKIQDEEDILNFKTDKNPALYKFNESIVLLLKPMLPKFNKARQSVTGKNSDDELKDFIKHLVFAVNQPNEEELGNILKNEISKEFDYITTENVYNKFFIEILHCLKRLESKEFSFYEDGKTFFDEIKRWIPIWFNVRDPVESFVGREQQLSDLHKLLQRDEITQTLQIISVTGCSGMGKTEFVRKYINTYSNNYDNKIIWINAESFKTLKEDFHKLAHGYLDINTTDANGKDIGMASTLKNVYEFFSNGKSLFVFDNVQKYKSQEKFDCGIQDFLPCLPSDLLQPNIIFISRNEQWPENVQILPLDVFGEKDAKHFITKSLSFKNDENSIVRLTKITQFFPLALQYAVAYIKMQNEYLNNSEMQFKIDDYLKKYNKEIENFNFNFPDDCDNIYSKTVLATLNVTFNSIKQKKAGNNALEILNILSYIYPKNIPTEILLSFLTDKQKLDAALELLKQYSMINTENTMLNVHELLQYVIRIQLQKKNKEQNILIEALKSFKEDNVNQETLDHVLSVWRHAYKYTEIVHKFSLVASYINAELIASGRYEDAYLFGNEISQLLRTVPRDHRRFPARNNSTTETILQLVEYEKALTIYQNIFEIQNNLFESSNQLNVTIQMNLALIFYNQEKYMEALRYYEQFLIKKRVLSDENDAKILTKKRDIARILTHKEFSNESKQILQELYNIQKIILGKNHPDTLYTKQCIADILLNQGTYEEALQIYQEILNIQKSTLGSVHPDTLNMFFKKAIILENSGYYDHALRFFKSLLDGKESVIDCKRPEIYKILESIARIHSKKANFDEALRTFQNILQIQILNLGDSHVDTLSTKNSIGLVLFQMNQNNEALNIFQDTLNKLEQIHENDNHVLNLAVNENIALVLYELKKYDDSFKKFQHILDMQEGILGKEHYDVAKTKANIGQVFIQQKKLSEALKIFHEALDIYKKVLNPNHGDILRTERIIQGLFLLHTKFLEAALSNHYEEVVHFINEGAYIDTKDSENRTALQYAVGNENLKIVNVLLQNGADVTQVSNKGTTPLHIAVSVGNEQIVETLLSRVNGTKLKNFVDTKTILTSTASLHVAAKNGYFNIVILLLSHGATYDIQNESGETPRELATNENISNFFKIIDEVFESAKRGHTSILDKLKDLNSKQLTAVANTRNNDGSTLLQIAAINKHKNIAIKLVELLKTLNKNL